MSRVATIVVSYRVPELADSILQSIKNTTTPNTWVEVENGYSSDRSSTIKLARNTYLTPAQLIGVEYSKALELIDNIHFDYFWFIVTCCSIVDTGDSLTKMVTFMDTHPECVISHPALDDSSVTAWPNLKRRGTEPRRTYGSETIAMLIRRDFYDQIGGFDRRLTHGWAVGLESSYLARKMGKEIYIMDNCLIHREEAIAWKMGRRDISREDYNKEAAREMNTVLSEKYHYPVPQIFDHLNYDYDGGNWKV